MTITDRLKLTLLTPTTITGSPQGGAAITKEATTLAIRDMNIHLSEDIETITMHLELQYGNIVSGEFVPLGLSTDTFGVDLPAGDVAELKVALSPGEREYDLLTIIYTRLMAYLKSKNYIK